MPDEAALDELREILKNHAAAWMIWEGEPAAESVSKLEALGIGSLVVDPCGNRPEQGDWLRVMTANARNLAKAAP